MDSLEALIKAKIPGPETGIEKKNTVCAICSPAYNCGVCAYVKDGKMVKLEGLDEHPRNKGCLCTKGLSGRGFAYREDRIKTPLRRTGKRGEGKFEPITWDEAYREQQMDLRQWHFSVGTINGSVRGCAVLPIPLEL